ncbi:MAG: hypothetical protein B7X39_16245 [Lysobacterales bacterium 14-68-21]|nr:MAG: hypothetical protein B7X45_14235 [Xanthomonadales bacterium 15-68-25]OZB64356.1 MAG: hypothetical protein B7X39_16245 [Xanthomonadales bacterium 14-68-21]
MEVLPSPRREIRAEVDRLVGRALDAVGASFGEPEDFGVMSTHGFVDPDGHGLGVLRMSGTPAP